MKLSFWPALIVGILLFSIASHAQKQAVPPAQAAGGGAVLEIRADRQRKEGHLFFAEGNVELRYAGMKLAADRVTYNAKTRDAEVQGHVVFERENQHLEAESAKYNFETGRGNFTKVKGTFRADRPSSGEERAEILTSPNPFYFEAEEVERISEDAYVVRRGWVTVCEPHRPKWTFYARRVRIHPRGKARLTHAVFRFLKLPALYLPVASVPVARLRESGFLLPHFSNSNNKGFIFGDSLYLAPADWLDFTLGAELLSRRGVAQWAEVRVRPGEESFLNASYFAVNDRGITDPSGKRIRQPGHTAHLDAVTKLAHGFRAVADINQLTSQAFRLAFSETFHEAVISEVKSTAFLTNNSGGLYWNLFATQYKNFISVSPEQAVILRSAPSFQFSSPDRAIPRLPVYFSWDVSLEGLRRHDPNLETSEMVRRFNLAPRVTLPIRLGHFLQIVPTLGVGLTNYGGRLAGGTFVERGVNRFTRQAGVDIRLPSFARVWNTPGGRLGDRIKHVIEPRIVYRYVNGVRDFARFIRFDALDTLTDTSELEYSFTQRLFTRLHSEDSVREWVTWKVAQKYYFDPTFGGALAEGRRNVFASFTSLSAFSFADRAKRFSPVISDIRINPGGRFDAEYRLDFDPREGRVTASGLAVNSRPYKEFFLGVAHYSVRNTAILAPFSNQIRFQTGYGSINRRGWNVLWGASYDFRQKFFQNNALQVSYNGACCGIAVEFRRLALGAIRAENQLRLAFSIANIGTFGNVRRQERIF